MAFTNIRKCYFAVQPDPETTFGYRRLGPNGNLQTCFDIKFGDGEPDALGQHWTEDFNAAIQASELKGAYKRANANCRMAMNYLAPPGLAVEIPSGEVLGSAVERQPGKILEYNMLILFGLLSDNGPWNYSSSRREWHTLVVQDENRVQDVKDLLCKLLATFPHFDTFVLNEDATPPSNLTPGNRFQDMMSALCWQEQDARYQPLTTVEPCPDCIVYRVPRSGP